MKRKNPNSPKLFFHLLRWYFDIQHDTQRSTCFCLDRISDWTYSCHNCKLRCNQARKLSVWKQNTINDVKTVMLHFLVYMYSAWEEEKISALKTETECLLWNNSIYLQFHMASQSGWTTLSMRISFAPKRCESKGKWIKLQNEEHFNTQYSPSII